MDSWQTLFERAAEHSITVSEIRDAVADTRGDTE